MYVLWFCVSILPGTNQEAQDPVEVPTETVTKSLNNSDVMILSDAVIKRSYSATAVGK